MSFKVIPTPTFAKSLKALAKRHKSLKEDVKALVAELERNPLQGVELTAGIRKIRMAIKSKGAGKSGGASVITYNVLVTEEEEKCISWKFTTSLNTLRFMKRCSNR